MPLEIFIKLCAVKSYVRLWDCFQLDWDGIAKTKRNVVSRRLVVQRLAWEQEVGSGESDEVREVVPLQKFRVNTDSFQEDNKYLRPS